MEYLRASLRGFMKLESASGILLLVATVLAMLVANSPLQGWYDALLEVPLAVQVGQLKIAKPLLLWINDGLMAVFFFLVGLEIKREVVKGELSQPAQIVLPGLAAVGGLAVPALVYVALNSGNPVALKGWAIPAATDIAFALGVLSLLGSRVPHALKVFLLTLAIVDDLAAILIIALFYSGQLAMFSLVVAAGALIILLVINRAGVTSIAPYLAVGVVLWVAVLKSGIHATLAGVLLAFFIPIKTRDEAGHSPLERLEHDLHTTVAFAILPLFAFANTGISFSGFSLGSLLDPVVLGIMLGLFIGKQVGVFTFAVLAVKTGLCRLPESVSWRAIYGVGILCGIGFTMSLFISSLAFEETGREIIVDDRLGILLGSLLSAVVGYVILHVVLPKKTW